MDIAQRVWTKKDLVELKAKGVTLCNASARVGGSCGELCVDVSIDDIINALDIAETMSVNDEATIEATVEQGVLVF